MSLQQNRQQLILLSTLLLTLFINNGYTKTPTEFHGIKTSNAEELLTLEKECPAVTDLWVKVTEGRTKLRELPFIFGAKARPAAEKEIKILMPKYKSMSAKLKKQSDTCQKNLTTDIDKISKRLAPLKNPSSATLKKRKQSLQKELATKKSALAAIKKIGIPHAMSMYHDTQRLKIRISMQSKKRLPKDYPTITKLRMTVQDNVADIKRLQKMDQATMTSADKQKLKRTQTQLKTNYTKLLSMSDSKKKLIKSKADKLNKEISALDVKIERAEKAKRSIDKLDEKRTPLMMSRNALTAEVQLLDKLVISTAAEKLL